MIKAQLSELEQVQAKLSEMEAEAQAKFVILDEYKTELCCLDKPELVRVACSLGMRKYSSKTSNHLMIGHLMTAKRRELGYEDLLEAIDRIKTQMALLQEAA